MTPDPGPTGPTPTRPGNPRPTQPPRPRIPDWARAQVFQFLAMSYLLFAGFVVLQADTLGYLPCRCDGTAVHPGITWTYGDGAR